MKKPPAYQIQDILFSDEMKIIPTSFPLTSSSLFPSQQCPSPRKSSSSDLTTTTKAISGKGQSSGGTTTTILKNGPSSNNNHNNNGCLSQQQQQQQTQIQQQTLPNAVAMSPVMQKNLGMQHYRSIECKQRGIVMSFILFQSFFLKQLSNLSKIYYIQL